MFARGPPGPGRGSLTAAKGPPLSLTGRPVIAREPPVSAAGHSVSVAAGLPPVKAKSDPYRARGPMQGLKGTQNGWVGLCKVCEHGRLKWAHSRPEWARLEGLQQKCPLFGPFSPKEPFLLFSYRYLTEGIRVTSAKVLTLFSCKHCLPYQAHYNRNGRI